MRPSGVELVAAFAEGVMSQGVDVVDVGLVSTDLVYFAAGRFDAPGAMFTASHNPAQYNGVKFCLSGARPVGADTGLADIKAIATAVLAGDGPDPAADPRIARPTRDLLEEFADHVVSFIDPAAVAPLRVVADTANGMGGLVVPKVFERLPQVQLEVMYGELDGTFPNHPADPIQPANQLDLQARVVSGGFDVGLAFDGDADRVFVVDETGRGLVGVDHDGDAGRGHAGQGTPGPPSSTTSSARGPCPRSCGSTAASRSARRSATSYIKQIMAETGAVFGGEHSAHYYFRDNYRADSGIIATMLVLEQLSQAGVPLSTARKPFERYAASGEINTAGAGPRRGARAGGGGVRLPTSRTASTV